MPSAISNTGQLAEVIRAARIARDHGATTIGITGSHGPLLDQCTISIVAETVENTEVFTPTVSRLSAMIVTDILSTAVSLGRRQEEQDRIAAMKRLLAEARPGRDGSPDAGDDAGTDTP